MIIDIATAAVPDFLRHVTQVQLSRELVQAEADTWETSFFLSTKSVCHEVVLKLLAQNGLIFFFCLSHTLDCFEMILTTLVLALGMNMGVCSWLSSRGAVPRL